MRRIPILSSLIVLVAVGVMIALGLWQIGRMEEKEALLARYALAASDPREAAYPVDEPRAAGVLYRRARIDCLAVTGRSSIAGRSAGGEAGLAQVADCTLASGQTALIVLGWSRDPVIPPWNGGLVAGIIAPGPRLVADPPLAGLEANARPDPRELPNNHWSYAVQWFLFAATALVIYGLALWKRMRRAD